MHKVQQSARQGDVLFRRVGALPDGTTHRPAEGGQHIVAHSETGHHHTVEARLAEMFDTKSDTLCYLRVTGEVPVVHHRSFDTHKPFTLTPGVWEVRRAREHTPEGWRRVQD